MSKRTDRSPRGERPARGPQRGPKRSSSDRPARRRDDGPDEGPRNERGPARPSRSPGRSGPARSRPNDRYADRDERRSAPAGGRPKRTSGDREERPQRPAGRGEGPRRPFGRPSASPRPEKPWKRQSKDERTFQEGDPLARRPFKKGERSNRFSLRNPANDGLIRLNRYLANAGVGSRREADELITSGAVTVNGKVVTELGTKVKPDDIVHFGGQKLSIEQKRYVLLNKPKDTITTTDDPHERHTVMDLIAKACPERLYPVGRLDRNTTGVLLLTNDGDLAKKLTHPSHGAEKIYHVTLHKSVAPEDIRRLAEGIHLDDGPAQADEVNYAGESRREVGIKLHMGRNRIVRRMFESLGYEVVKLDRVLFAGLTKKDLQRGHWRHLTEKEIAWLKQLKSAPKDTKAARGGRRTRLSYGNE
ncbi:MAG: RNA-binding S4 domain-containing protein [Bacteroidetes bacterium]|nr:RNA-binding S4 domain-containing protein [Bacteroidota bacterium]